MKNTKTELLKFIEARKKHWVCHVLASETRPSMDSGSGCNELKVVCSFCPHCKYQRMPVAQNWGWQRCHKLLHIYKTFAKVQWLCHMRVVLNLHLENVIFAKKKKFFRRTFANSMFFFRCTCWPRFLRKTWMCGILKLFQASDPSSHFILRQLHLNIYVLL